MSNEKEDLQKSVITPAPPLDCQVGVECQFVLSTRTRLGLLLPHGGLTVAVRPAHSDAQTECLDNFDGTYLCAFSSGSITVKGEFDFVVSADDEEFEPIRQVVDPSTGSTSTVATYSSLSTVVSPISCTGDHSHPDETGGICVCEELFYRRAFGDSQWACERCDRGQEPSASQSTCQSCNFGKYSPDGERCEVCEPGTAPNKQVSADSCQECDEVSVSIQGVACNRCSPDEESDSSRTKCVCPANRYNSSKMGGRVVRCLSQGLRGDDQAATSECVPCGDLECVACGAGELVVRTEYSVAQIDQPWLVFKCPFEGACQNTGEQRCKIGHTGLLCAVCEDGYSLDRDDCVECSATNSNPYAAGALVGAASVVAAAIYLWYRRGCGPEGNAEPLQGLIANPLQVFNGSGVNLRGSASSGSGKAAAAMMQKKTTDLYTLLRVVYQPGRIIVGYIQVVTQIGPVLDLEFPRYIRALLEALKPFMIDLQSILQLDCLSGGLLNFYATWILRVFVIPAAMLGIVGLQYCYERRRVGHGTAAGIFKANAFVVVFLCYPGVCNQAFGMFNCREVGVDLSVLVKDYSVHCSTEKHTTFQVIAGLYIAVVAFGIPLRMARLMFKRMREYGGGSASDKFVARRAGDELKLDDQVAADAIRDCNTGREYSFLVNAFKPRYYFWEGRVTSSPIENLVNHSLTQFFLLRYIGYDMIRKLMLVGMLMVAGRGSVAQLFAAIVISFVSFSLQVQLMPYRHAEDNVLKAAVEVHIFLLVAIALVLKGLRSEAGGETVPEAAYDVLLITSFVLCVPGAFVWAVSKKKATMEQALQQAGVTIADEQSVAARQRAIRLLQLGLTTNDDMRLLASYFTKLDAMVNKMT